ncbi:DUF4192 domain-containing protein [Streptomyces sp. NPDC059076]|uniref:DUF4192 domain-containing protein n=1 Tax=unclassified Streptomyces TaxID=2593676 RepID=UPI0036B25498
MNSHHESMGTDEQQVTLRSAAELADALPYVLGYHPSDSIVVVALHGSRGRFGARVQLGIPPSPLEWPSVSQQLAECLIEGSERHGRRPDGIVVFLCQDPTDDESARAAMERLRPLSHSLRTACGALDVPVYEALCISAGRFWSYCCPDDRCCPSEGNELAIPGTSVMAAAAAYAGVRVRGSQRELEARLRPPSVGSTTDQRRALDKAGTAMVTRLLEGGARTAISDETLALAGVVMARIARTRPSAADYEADVEDDSLLTVDEAAILIHGLQDRETRDKAARWSEGSAAESALRLWRALSRRCVSPYAEYAAPSLTLAGWTTWSLGDKPAARVAFGLALSRDPQYILARLFQQACNQDLDVETVRQCLRMGHGQTTDASTVAGRTASDVRGDQSSTALPLVPEVKARPRTTAETVESTGTGEPSEAQMTIAISAEESAPIIAQHDSTDSRRRPRRAPKKHPEPLRTGRSRPPSPAKPRQADRARPGSTRVDRPRRHDPDRRETERETEKEG